MSKNASEERHLELDMLLQQKRQLHMQMEQINHTILQRMEQQSRQAFQPLSKDTLKDIIETHMGTLKVNDVLMLTDIAPATYYKTIRDMTSVKVTSLMAVLDTVGLQLYIGRKAAGNTPDITKPRE